MKVLITGALGYIGSITSYLISKQRSDIELILIDNLSNSSLLTLEKFQEFKCVRFLPYDITNKSQMEEIFSENKIDLVIHFAGLKSVKESFFKKEEYYRVNVFGTFQLLETMVKFRCQNIIFSSSACVYSDDYEENKVIDLNKIHNPYGKTKYICEELIRNYSDKIKGVVLRYFNPVGTIKGFYHKPKQIENLMDVILNSIQTKEKFYVFGNDYETKDGTCVRDFIHVEDLAESHIRAIDWILNDQISQFEIFNIGTGKGISVFELIHTFEKVNGIKLNYEIKERRKGDIVICFANCDKTKHVLNWKTKKTLEEMCKSYYL
jgi:UDP-glucose 4-epimerase